MLLDTGAFTNLGGGDTVRAQVTLAAKAGYQTTQRRLPKPLFVSGVGSGVKKCEWEVNLPVAVPSPDGGATLHRIVIPCLEKDPQDPNDKSAELPIIQGSQSLSSHKAVIEVAPEGRKVTFPGPGGYKIEWAPGAVTVPLETARSGHPMMPIGEFSRLSKKKGGLSEDSMTFHAAAQQPPPPPEPVVTRPPRPTRGSSKYVNAGEGSCCQYGRSKECNHAPSVEDEEGRAYPAAAAAAAPRS